MWLITFHVVPKPGTSKFNESGGAYVNCWILYAWQDGAEHLAKYEVEKEWIITETLGVSWIEAEDVADDPDKEYFDQALIDGGTFVYDLYPFDAEDEEDEDFEVEPEAGLNDDRLKTNH